MSSKMARQAKGQAKAMGVVTSKGAPKLKLGTESVLDIFDDDTRRGKRKQLKKVTIVPKLTDESDPAHPKFGQAKEKPPKLGKSKAKLAMRKEIAKQYADFDRELHRTLVVSWILVVLGAAEVVCGSIIWDWDIPYTNNGFHRGAWWAGTLAFSSGVCGVLTYRSQVRCPFPARCTVRCLFMAFSSPLPPPTFSSPPPPFANRTRAGPRRHPSGTLPGQALLAPLPVHDGGQRYHRAHLGLLLLRAHGLPGGLRVRFLRAVPDNLSARGSGHAVVGHVACRAGRALPHLRREAGM
jgi:hypothetical protein